MRCHISTSQVIAPLLLRRVRLPPPCSPGAARCECISANHDCEKLKLERHTFPFGKPQLAPDFQPFTMRHLSIAGLTMMAPKTGTLCCRLWVSLQCCTADAWHSAPCTL